MKREVLGIDFEDSIQFHEAEDKATIQRHGTAAQPCAATTGDDGDFVLLGEFEALGDLLGGGRKRHAARLVLQGCGAVEAVRNKIFRRGQKRAFRKKRGER